MVPDVDDPALDHAQLAAEVRTALGGHNQILSACVSAVARY
jgi:hypothetical protein